MITLEAAPARAVMAPEAGGRVASLTVHGVELLVTEQRAIDALAKAPGPFGWGIFPMAPWAGRIRRGEFSFQGRHHQLPINFPPHAIHGTLADGPADAAEQVGPSEAVLTWALGPPWPFSGRATQSVTLANDSLTLEMEIQADEPMPVTCGWHPWWSRQIGAPGPAELDFAPTAMYRLDDEGIPTGELVPPSAGPWDDCFAMPSSPTRLRWPGALEVTLESDCAELVVFNERPYGICVEPQTGPPDAVNLGIHCASLGAGDVLTARARWSWRALT
jgi:aldose 1-epimerase